MNHKRIFSMFAALCSVVSLSACDTLMGDECHIDSEYRISCGDADLPEFHEPNS